MVVSAVIAGGNIDLMDFLLPDILLRQQRGEYIVTMRRQTTTDRQT